MITLDTQSTIMDAIEKTLPSIQAKQMKDFFDKFTMLEVENKALKAELEHLFSKAESELEVKKQLYADIVSRDKTLAKHEVTIVSQKTIINSLEEQLKNIQLSAEEEKTSMMMDPVSMVFKHPKKITEFNTTATDVLSNMHTDYQGHRSTSSFVQQTPIKSTQIEEIQ
jgi:phosphoribosylformylglycinamidine (FGAM) synthase PurS component